MKNTKTKLISSVTVLLICFAMLIGSTFAWFTDSASTGVNKIQAGNLDVVLSVKNKTGSGPEWSEVSEATTLFHIGDNTKWEPGVMTYETLKVENKGNLALDYTLGFLPTNVTKVGVISLLDVIKVYYGNTRQINTENRSTVLESISSLTPVKINQFSKIAEDMSASQSEEIVIVLYWKPTDNDNAYNLSGNPLKADLGIELVAKQANVESDSFGDDYDASALYPIEASVNIGTSINASNNTTTAELVAETSLKDSYSNPVAKVTVPSGAVVNSGATKLTLSVDETSTPSGVVISSTANSKTLEIKVDGLSTNNIALLKVETNIGAGLGDITLRHITDSTETTMTKKGTLESVQNNQDYYYDNNTGMLTFLSDKFSPFVIEYPKELWSDHASEGCAADQVVENEIHISNEADFALFAKQVNESEKSDCFKGKTFILDADLDLGQYLWMPIGQTGHGQFAGTFDGNGHTIKNLNISNADESKDCASGLFGWLNNATVKNLTIDVANVGGHHNVGAIAGYMETSGCIIENCHVLNATISCTSVNDDANGDKCGGIVGHAGNVGVKVQNCTVKDTSISAGRDAGQVVGGAKVVNVTDCSATNVTVSANGTSTGANINEEVIGREL